MITIVNAIIEIESLKDQRQESQRIDQVITTIKKHGINKIPVLEAVRQWASYGNWNDKDNRCIVAHFGYNIRCAEGHCVHKNEDNGVIRYFGINLILDGLHGREMFGDFKVESTIKSSVCICGLNNPYVQTGDQHG